MVSWADPSSRKGARGQERQEDGVYRAPPFGEGASRELGEERGGVSRSVSMPPVVTHPNSGVQPP